MARVRRYKGKTRIDLRKFVLKRSGEVVFTKKGVVFSKSEWEEFKNKI
jgi:hypothetical protein